MLTLQTEQPGKYSRQMAVQTSWSHEIVRIIAQRSKFASKAAIVVNTESVGEAIHAHVLSS